MPFTQDELDVVDALLMLGNPLNTHMEANPKFQGNSARVIAERMAAPDMLTSE